MDYLDPEKKKAHKRRLYIGYGLMAILIALMTVVLVYLGSGFYVDRQTGNLIQNGQIYIASNPEGAQIFLNDKQQKTKTTGKLFVPSGSYSVAVKKDGYRDWTQQVELEGGKINRLDYVRLLPTILKTTSTQTFAGAPTQVVQSKDRRYFAMTFADKPTALFVYDLIKPEVAPVEMQIPDTIFTNPAKKGSIHINEWSNDNKHLLVEHRVPDAQTEYLLMSRDASEVSTNLTSRFGLTNELLRLVGGSRDTFFVHNQQTLALSTIRLDDRQLIPKLQNVRQYAANDADTIAYMSPSVSDPSKMQARMTDGSTSYTLREYPIGKSFLLALSKNGSTPVVAVGAIEENKITIMRNPIGYLKANNDKTIPLATTIFLLDKPSRVVFSPDGSVVMAQGNDKIATHYFEDDKTTRFSLSAELAGSALSWIDTKQLTAATKDGAYVIDFDGKNQQFVGSTNQRLGTFYDNNFRSLYTFSQLEKPFSINRSLLTVTE